MASVAAGCFSLPLLTTDYRPPTGTPTSNPTAVSHGDAQLPLAFLADHRVAGGWGMAITYTPASMDRGKSSRGGLGVVRTLNMLAFLPIAGRAPLYGRLLWSLASDPRVPASRKLLLGLAAAYIVSPVDLIPEGVPVLGALDDVAVLALAVDVFLEGLPESLVREKLERLGIPRDELETDLKRVRRIVPGPIRRLVARLPDAMEGVATFAHERGLDRRLYEMTVGRERASSARPSAAAAESDMPTSTEGRPA